jgi:hypothetical protein
MGLASVTDVDLGGSPAAVFARARYARVGLAVKLARRLASKRLPRLYGRKSRGTRAHTEDKSVAGRESG